MYTTYLNCVSGIKPWLLTAQRREYDLNGIPYRVHWMRKRLTAQHERLIPIIWSNICDCNTGLWSIIAGNVLIWLQSKIEEAKFNDVPAGNWYIPGTSAVLWVVTWKIWSWKESTEAIKIFAGGTSCNQRKQTVIQLYSTKSKKSNLGVNQNKKNSIESIATDKHKKNKRFATDKPIKTVCISSTV